LVLDARNKDEYEPAFEAARRERAGGLIVGSEGLFINAPEQLVALAARYGLPVIYAEDKPAKNGGLISYGADQDEGFRLVGEYAGRILKGEKGGRYACAAIHENATCRQSQDLNSPWPDPPALADGPCE